MIFLFLNACLSQTTPSITWNGYVYQQTLEEDDGLALFDNGTVQLMDLSGNVLAQASNPFEGTPSYWQFDLTQEQLQNEVAIRVSAENTVAMVWRAQTPSTNATWLSGGLLTQEVDYAQTYFDSFTSEITDVDVTDDTVVHLWGQPLIGADWANVTIEVFDGEGESAEVFTFTQLSNGSLTSDTSSGVTWFFAWNLVPGDIEVRVTTELGESASTVYPTQGGDIVSAMFYALPEVIP